MKTCFREIAPALTLVLSLALVPQRAAAETEGHVQLIGGMIGGTLGAALGAAPGFFMSMASFDEDECSGSCETGGLLLIGGAVLGAALGTWAGVELTSKQRGPAAPVPGTIAGAAAGTGVGALVGMLAPTEGDYAQNAAVGAIVGGITGGILGGYAGYQVTVDGRRSQRQFAGVDTPVERRQTRHVMKIDVVKVSF